MIENFDFNLSLLFSTLLRLIAAFVLTLPVALERENSTRIMGMRTYPIVAMGSCAYFLIAQRVFGGDSDPMARIFQGLIQGIGFLGTAAIIKQKSDTEENIVVGTATAASIWSTGAIGAAAAYGFYEIGIAVSLITFAVLRYFSYWREHWQDD